MIELLPWLNLLLVPMLGYLIGIERRLTRLEAIREVELQDRQEGGLWHRRSADPRP